MNPDLRLDLDRYVLRPCQPDDLNALERFGAASAHGLTSLPDNRSSLAARIERSMQSFATTDVSGEEVYLFVLDDLQSGEVVGVSGIAAQAGFADRFYCYRNEFVVHRSQALAYSSRIHTLHLCHDLTGATLLTSFYIDRAHRDTLAPQLLSRARLLFIAQHPERFSDRIAAESPGLADDSGCCPFWNAVGRRFFGMDYPAAEQLAGGRSKAFIAELMPTSPIYVPLLPEDAQWAIGQLHPDAELPFSILSSEGFEPDTYVDIFDGGPIVVARLGMLGTVMNRTATRVNGATMDPASVPVPVMAANASREGFRATLTEGNASGHALSLGQAAMASLELAAGDHACACDLRRLTWETT